MEGKKTEERVESIEKARRATSRTRFANEEEQAGGQQTSSRPFVLLFPRANHCSCSLWTESSD